MVFSPPAPLILAFLLLPCFANACPPTLPCNPSIEILPPFYLQSGSGTDPNCQGYLPIECNNGVPFLLWLDLSNPLESISYNRNIITVQDPYMSSLLRNSGCGNLYFSFSSPVSDFHYNMYYALKTSLPSVKCRPPNQIQSPSGMFGKDYNLSYSTTLDKDNYKHAQNCSRPENSRSTFELMFLFEEDSAELSLQSAGYSSDLVARPGCFSNSSEVLDCKGCKGLKVYKKVIILVSTMAVPLIIITVFLSIAKIARVGSSKESEVQAKIENIIYQNGSFIPKRYTYAELKRITNSFNDELGKGGFGRVFKGILKNGCPVAVKLLYHDSSHNGEEFVNEVMSIGRTSHINIVALLGFCIDKSNHALIYEYVPNSSLDKYINSKNPKENLGWEKLQEIAVSVARGLEYLHRGCSTRIVHFDIKPQNILLDEDFGPKIADFGLAKLCSPKVSNISLAEMRGTIGYIAPEVFSRSFGVVSTKSDVYSYGVMVLETVGARRSSKPCIENSSQAYFPNWIHDHLVEGTEIELCEVTTETETIARKMALIGLWCTQTNPANRPSMGRVLEMFERSLDELELPPKPLLER